MRICDLARFLRISVDAVIDAARELSMVDEEAFIQALQLPPGNGRYYIRDTACQSLTSEQLRDLLVYYHLDDVSPEVLLRSCETKIARGDCRTHEIEEILRALDMDVPGFDGPDPKSKEAAAEPDLTIGSGKPLPGPPFTEPFYERDKLPKARLWKIGATIAGVSLVLGFAVAKHIFPDLISTELDKSFGTPTLSSSLALGAMGLFSNLWCLGFGVVYLFRALRRFPWSAETSGPVLGSVKQFGLDYDYDDSTGYEYPMVLVAFEVSAKSYLGLYGDHYNLKLDHVTFAIGPSAKAPPGTIFPVYYDPEDPADFSLSKQTRMKGLRVVLGAACLAAGVFANFVYGYALHGYVF